MRQDPPLLYVRVLATPTEQTLTDSDSFLAHSMIIDSARIWLLWSALGRRRKLLSQDKRRTEGKVEKREGRKEGRKDGWKGGGKYGGKEEGVGGRKEGRKEGRKQRKTQDRNVRTEEETAKVNEFKTSENRGERTRAEPFSLSVSCPAYLYAWLAGWLPSFLPFCCLPACLPGKQTRFSDPSLVRSVYLRGGRLIARGSEATYSELQQPRNSCHSFLEPQIIHILPTASLWLPLSAADSICLWSSAVWFSICSYICDCVRFSLCVRLSSCLSVCLPAFLCVCVSVHVSESTFMPVCTSAYLLIHSMCLYVGMSVCLSQLRSQLIACVS